MAQRKFAAAARKYGGRIPRGAKVSSTRRAPATKRKTKTTTRRARAPAKQLGWFESKGRKWSEARKAAGGLWLPAAQRNRDPNSTVEYGPANNPDLAASEVPPDGLPQPGDSSVMFGPQIPDGQLAEIRDNLDFYQGSGSTNAALLAKLSAVRRGMPVQDIRRPAGPANRRPPTRPSKLESRN